VVNVTDPYGSILGFLETGAATFLSSSSSVVKPSQYKKETVKLLLQQAEEAHRVVRRRGSHTFKTVVSQMAVRLSPLRPRPTLPWYSFLLDAESTTGS
jgi:hypothetical protein